MLTTTPALTFSHTIVNWLESRRRNYHRRRLFCARRTITVSFPPKSLFMGAHEQLEKVLTWSPRVKVAAVFLVIVAIAAVLYGSFRVGGYLADSRFSRERQRLENEIERRTKNEAQLAGENALLKKQNEAAAEALRSADSARTTANEKKFADLLTERTKRLDEIDADADYDSQLCGLCVDARRSGYKLSEQLCGRCQR